MQRTIGIGALRKSEPVNSVLVKFINNTSGKNLEVSLSFDKAELIKKKIERLAKENREDELDFVLVLLSNDGYVPKYGLGVSFQRYISKYGEDTFEKVKQKLIEEEALLRETSDRLELNYYQLYQLSLECSRLIFEMRNKDYLSRLSSITAEPEGEYVVSTLASYYSSFIYEDKMAELEKEVGRSYFKRITDDLESTGILFRHTSSGQSIYWRLFPPVNDFCNIRKERHKEALTYIYITTQGGGFVHELNYSQWNDVIPSLRYFGLINVLEIERVKWYKVTQKGADLIRSNVRDRLARNRTEIQKLLDSAPKKLVGFLLKEVFLQYGHYPALQREHPEVLKAENIWCDVSRGQHICLLKDPKVRDWRNKILNRLKEAGLCYLVYSFVHERYGYVSSGMNYYLAPEIEELFTDYLKKIDDGDVFTPSIESIHRAYHFLGSISPCVEMEMSQVNYYMNFYRLEKEEGDKILHELVNQNIAERTAQGLKVKDSRLLKDLTEKKFEILVNYILEKGIQPEIKDETPPLRQPEQQSPIMPAAQEPPKEGEISILLGRELREKTSVFWNPTKEKNPHVLVVGTTGSGKTETLKALIHELRKHKIKCLILDYHDEYSQVSDSVINIRKGITINPLELLERPPRDTRYEVSSILREIYGLGDQQEAYLREAIKSAYESKGIYDKESTSWKNQPPDFSDVKRFLEERMEESSQSRGVVTTLLNRLEPIFDIEIFTGSTTISFDQIVGKTTAIQLKDLPTEEVKTAVSDFFLRRLWYYMYKLGQSKELRFYCVVDEGHRLAYEKSPLDQFLREARKYGVGVILSSQRPSDFSETVVANVATLVCLQCPLDNDSKFMAKQLNCDPHDVQLLDEKGKAIVKFSSSKDPLKVQITPLSQRS